MDQQQVNTGSVAICRRADGAKALKKGRQYHVIRQYVIGGFSYLELEGLAGRFSIRRFDITKGGR